MEAWVQEALGRAGVGAWDPPPLDPSRIDAWERRQAIRGAQAVWDEWQAQARQSGEPVAAEEAAW